MSQSPDTPPISATPEPLTAWERDWQISHAAERANRQRRPLGRSLWRGLRLRCPQCNQPGLMAAEKASPTEQTRQKKALWRRLMGRTMFLRPVDHCPHCGEAFGHIRTDDFAPWLTILALGHILLPAMITVERLWHPDLWLQALIWLPIAVEFIRAALPRAKGVALGLMWALGLRGDEHSY